MNDPCQRTPRLPMSKSALVYVKPVVSSRRSACLALVALFSLLPGWASAQSAPADVNTIDPAIKNDSPISKAEQDVIKAFIATQLRKLKDTAPITDVEAIRKKLINDVNGVGNPATPAYVTEYLSQLNSAMQPMIADVSVPMSARISMGTVVYKLSISNPDPALIPLVTSMLKDPQEAIALLGMKSSGYLLAAAATPTAGQQMLAAMRQALVKHNFSGPLTDDFYRALRATMEPNPQMLPVVLPTLIDVYAQRADLYKNGLPEWPAIDAEPIVFLAAKAQWTNPGFTPPQQAQVMQTAAKVVQSASAILTGAQPPTGTAHDETIALIKLTAESTDVIGNAINNPTLVAAVAAAKHLTAASSNANISSATQSLVDGINAAFPKANAGNTSTPTTQSSASGHNP